VARGEPRVLEKISSGPPSAGRTKSLETALARPKAAAGESCKQHLGSLPTAECSFTYVSEFLQTTSFWCRPYRWVISLPMLSKFFESRVRIQTLRDSPAGSLLESFAQALSEAGYTTKTARRHPRAAEHFIDWTHRQGLPARKLNEPSLAGFERFALPKEGHVRQQIVACVS
jgi:hypothetical protein